MKTSAIDTIKKRMCAQRISVEMLAARTGISEARLKGYFTGRKLQFADFYTICKALSLDISDFK